MNNKKEGSPQNNEQSQNQKNIVSSAQTPSHIIGGKWVHYTLISLLGIIIIFSIVNFFNKHLFWNHFELIDFTLHSSIEALGAIAALLMAFMPLQVLFGKTKPAYIFISIGFLQMGLWDLFHSFYKIGDGFVFTHSVALLAGGLMFSLIVFPWKLNLESAKKYLFIIGGITTIILATLTAYDRTIFPEMVHDGKFTNTANIINLLAGILFFISALKLISIYIRDKNLGVLILVFIAVSSGIVGITFQFSEVWSDGWWLWHIIRLIAFLATLIYMLWRIQKVSAGLNLALENLNSQYLITTQSEKKFKGLFNSDPSAIIIADPLTGLLVDANPAAELLMEMDRNELIGMHQSKLHPEDIVEEQVENFKRLQNQANVTVNSEILTKSGIRKFVEIKVSKVEFENKPFILGIFHDISTLVQQQDQLKQSAENSHAIINSLPGLFYQISPEGKFVKWNENFEAISGYSSKEMNELSPLDLFEGEEKNRIHANIQKVFTDGDAIAEAHLISKSGEKTPFFFTGKLINIDNNPLLIGMGLDISEQKDAETKLRESEDKYRSLIKATPLPLCLTDNAGNLTYINDRFEQVFGYSLSDIPTLDEWWLKAYPDEKYRTWVLDTWNKAVENARIKSTDIESVEYEVTCKNGKKRIIIISGITLENGFLATFIDITERKRAEEKLKESEVKFRQTFDFSPVGVVMVGLDKKFMQINATYANMLGYEMDEMIGKTIEEMTYPEDKSIGMADMMAIVKGEKVVSKVQKRYMRKDKKLIWVEVTISLLRNHEGSPLYFLGIIQDITKNRRAEEQLKVNEEKFRSVFENSPIGKSMTGTDGSLNVNKTFCDLLGYSEAEIKKMKWQEITHPDDIQNSADIVQSIVDGKKTKANYEKRYIHKNGHVVWTDVNTTLQRDAQGKPLFFITSIIDITLKKEWETELILKNIVFESSVSANTTTNTKGILNSVNAAFLKIWGYQSADEVIGRSLAEFIKNEDEALQIITSLNNTGYWTGEYTALKKDGTTFIAQANASILKDADDHFIGYQSSVVDITEKKKSEEELRNAMLSLERSNRELETFNKMAVGREKRMIDLKRKINTLSIELGQEEVYDLSFADVDINQEKEA